MTTPTPPPTRSGITTALVVVAVMFCVTLTVTLLAFLFAPPDRDVAIFLGPALGLLAPTVASVALLFQVRNVQAAQVVQGERLERVAQDTHDLTNGLLDAKVRAATAEVVHDDLIDPAIRPQLAEDRAVRDQAHTRPAP